MGNYIMATTSTTNKNSNLFYQLYSKSNDLTQSGFTCLNAIDEKDTSFDISGSNGEITDSNGNTISSIDMSVIHSDEITEYYTETKVLQPYSAYLLQGNVTGDTYAAQFFIIPEDIQKQESYESFINLQFDIHYTECGELKGIHIDTYKLRTEPGSVCEIIQNKFDELKIPVTITIKNLEICDCKHPGCNTTNSDFVVFQSSSEGYSFYVHSVYVTAIDTTYENYNGEWVDYSETPFIGANITFDYIIDLLKTKKPRYKGTDSMPDYTNVPCDIYKYLVSIAPLAIKDKAAFDRNVKCLTEFAKCFDNLGELIDSEFTTFSYISTMYNDIYSYYWGNEYSIMNKYNIHDILDVLNSIAFYVFDSNVHGPYVLEEDYERRIYNQKYHNGAFRGLVLIPDWNSETNDYSVLKLAHVSDYVNIDEQIKVPSKYRVEGFWCNECVNIYRKIRANVKINTLLQSEYEVYKACDCNTPLRKVTSNESLSTCMDGVWTYEMHPHISNDTIWTNNTSYSDGDEIWSDTKTHKEHHHNNHIDMNREEYVDEMNSSKYDFMKNVPGHTHKHHHNKENAIGLYRYMQYLNENDLWSRVGQAYMIIGAKDDYQSKIKNLQNNVLIYNQNNVHVREKFIVFL